MTDREIKVWVRADWLRANLRDYGSDTVYARKEGWSRRVRATLTIPAKPKYAA